jgi:hypothetical protein
MNKIEQFTSILGRLEELDKEKFNSSEFQKVNTKLQELLAEISTNKEEFQSDNFVLENKNIFLEIVSKIESLQEKILPKAEIIDSFSRSQV